MAVHCDSCDRPIPLGETYHETLTTLGLVGAPLPQRVTKSTLCNACWLVVDGA